ncbi:tetratricopeptide repeat protein [Synechococcus elongatus]|uniref:tetratricopeptide repeat protein n=1 Tax=Synechococcus elongatus TaxID=32046 RepID=UPI0030CC6F49
MSSDSDVLLLKEKALEYFSQGNLVKALEIIEEAGWLAPQDSDVLQLWGSLLAEADQFQDAVEAFEEALKYDREDSIVWANYGLALFKLGQSQEAELAYQKSLSCNPKNESAILNYARLLQTQYRSEEAWEALCQYGEIITQWERSKIQAARKGQIFWDFEDPIVLDLAGFILIVLRREREAIFYLEKAVRLAPEFITAWNNLGNAFAYNRDLEKAQNAFNKVLELNPIDIHASYNKATITMMSGNFQDGWDGYEYRFIVRPDTQAPENYLQKPRWQGEALHNKVLIIWGEQGYGDQIQFCRYLKIVRNHNPISTIKLLVRPELSRLMQEQFEILGVNIQVITSLEGNEDCDLQCPLLSLPYILKNNCNYIPHGVYFNILKKNKLFPTQNLKVGITWKTGFYGKNINDIHIRVALEKSCPVEYFVNILNVSDKINIYSLQIGNAIKELESYLNHPRLFSIGDGIEDFKDTADLLSDLDLLITVDTSVAHLAAAMGIRTWLLLNYYPDWRWGLSETQTPWYCSMKIYRQESPKNWQSIFDKIKGDLLALTLR